MLAQPGCQPWRGPATARLPAWQGPLLPLGSRPNMRSTASAAPSSICTAHWACGRAGRKHRALPNCLAAQRTRGVAHSAHAKDSVHHCLSIRKLGASNYCQSRSYRSYQQPPCAAVRCSATAAGGSSEAHAAAAPRHAPASVAANVVAVALISVLNRVLYRMSLVPLANYAFVLAQLQTVAYVVAYFTILAFRVRSGAVTPAMLAVPTRGYALTFVGIGAAEACSNLLAFVGAARLPGILLPMLLQSQLLWQLALNRLILGQRFARERVMGALMVAGGVVLAAWPGPDGAGAAAAAPPLFAGIFILSTAFPALAAILKDRLFASARRRLGGQDLDIFVMNSFSALAQGVFVAALLPVLATAQGLSLSQLPDLIHQGVQCLRGLTPACGTDCALAPRLVPLYLAVNVTTNAIILNLIRSAGNVAMTLTMTAVVPLNIWVFSCALPILPPAPRLGPQFLAGVAVVTAGLLLYNWEQLAPLLRRARGLQPKQA